MKHSNSSTRSRPDRPLLVLANFPHGVQYLHELKCFFQSAYASKRLGYFNRDAMPMDAIVHLLRGGRIRIIDSTTRSHVNYTHPQKFGVVTWVTVFNLALGYEVEVCEWVTKDMYEVAKSRMWTGYRHSIKTVADVYGNPGPIYIGAQVELDCRFNTNRDERLLKFTAR